MSGVMPTALSGSTMVTTGYSGKAVLLDASNGRPIDRYPRAWSSAAFSADGATLVTSGPVVRVLDLAVGKVTASAHHRRAVRSC